MQSISIDIRMFHHTGIGRYLQGLVPNLISRQSRWHYRLIGNENFRASFPNETPYIPTLIPIYSLREQIIIPRLASHSNCLHVPHYNAPLFWRGKLVVTIHDLIHLHFKEDLPSPLASFYANTMLPKIVKRADRLIAVSQFTKDDLIKTLGVSPEKITVIHHGIHQDFLKHGGEIRKPKNSNSIYFLCVGLIKKHKNIGTLINAFRALKQKNKAADIKLVLVGDPDRKQSIVQEWLAQIRKEEGIQLLSRLSDNELIKLYRGATALIFPSLYEGFGFPLLEAMASCTPIIAARTSSIPEVVGEKAALYFDPLSTSELTKHMDELIRNESLRKRLVEEGIKRLPSFDWKVAAQKTEQVYESALGSNQ